MIILLHTSKTMRTLSVGDQELSQPALNDKSKELVAYIQSLDAEQIMRVMRVSSTLADAVVKKYKLWNDDLSEQSSAIDSFIGDIYSGLQASALSDSDRVYANTHLRILSGLYGVLKPFDGIMPYRLEMGYRLLEKKYANLYTFWGDAVAKMLPSDEPIINLAAIEYSKLVTPFVDSSRVVTPRFLTLSEATNEPVFVVVHAKIARGAFARWMITSRIESLEQLHEFNEIGYEYDEVLSTQNEPVFICKEFGGKGLSMRLEGKE